VTAEVAAEVNRQKAATQALIAQGARMNQALNQLSQSVSISKQVSEENAQLKTAVNTTQQRLEALEEAFRQKQTETTFTTPSVPPKQGSNDW
jgi:seryl-tRNA synthetase